MLSVLTFRTPDEAVAKANNTTYGLSAGIWTEKGSRILKIADQLRAGVVWANTFNKFDPTSPFGGYKQSGYGREGGRHGLTGYLKGARTVNDRLAVRKTYKLYVGGAFPRSESGRTYEVTDAKGDFLANAAWASRKDARDAVVAARARLRQVVGRDGLQPRPGALPRGRDDGGPARPVRAPRSRPARGCPPQGAAPPSTPRSTAGSGTPAGPTSSPQVLGGANPVAGPYFDFSVPEPTGVVAVLAPQQSSLLGLVSVLAPVIVRGNTAVVVVAQPAAAGGDPRRGAGDQRRPGRRGQPAHRRGRGAGALAGRARGRQRHRPHRAPAGLRDGAGARGGRHGQAGRAAPLHRARLEPTPDSRRITPFLERKTVWHPIGV